VKCADLLLNGLLDHPLFAGCAPSATLRAKPLGFVDIGARGGLHDVVKPLAGITATLAFEPDQLECERLRAELAANSPWVKWAVEPVALAAKEGEATLHVLASSVNSSLRQPNEQFVNRYKMNGFQVVETLSVPTTTLDNLLFGPRAGEDFWGEFLKIDTQGTELEILQGAERTLAERTVAIICEAEFFEMYQGEKLFSEVEQFLRARGFSIYGFDLHHRSRKLLDKHSALGRERSFFVDAIFFKDPLPGGRQTAPPSLRACHSLFACALLLGFFDFALELALETWAKGEEARRIETLVRDLAAQPAKQAYDEALALAERVRANPHRANIEVGRFVDQRRHFADFDDVP
jgi:FkbM family methyltransferase